MMRHPLLGLVIVASSLLLSACGEQPKVHVVSIDMVSTETGSPDFRRMVKICFDKPLSGVYHHEVRFESKDGFVLEGSGKIQAAVSDPDNPCILKNLNQYVTKNSPPRSRDLIDRYLAQGNVASVSISIWGDESGAKGLKMDTKVFNDR
ncbi:MAG: hypothetical protein JHC38_06920 [Thiotrichales bacterium]|jgi:hypothetical protein|nr:hypothetical protein [Thiotrichales bacterium]